MGLSTDLGTTPADPDSHPSAPQTLRLTIAYLGAGFAGWQRQPNAVAVQEVLETALERLLGVPVVVIGASRTDSGVHARGQVAHLRMAPQAAARASLRALVHGTNHHLPPAVRVLAADRVAHGFHARKSAAAKEYRYRMSRAPVLPPFDAPFAVPVSPRLDVERMRAATAALIGRHDFSAFARAGGSHRQPWRRIFSADLREHEVELVFSIVGDGFLRGMVRALVGTLIEVGKGRRTVEGWAELLTGGGRSAAGETAPAHGLTLERVHYASPFGQWQAPGGEPACRRSHPGSPLDEPAEERQASDANGDPGRGRSV